MRLRKKKGVEEKLRAFEFVLDSVGEELKGQWRKLFAPSISRFLSSDGSDSSNDSACSDAADAEPLMDNPKEELFVELGTGKGEFISALAARNPSIDFVGLEVEPTVLYAAARKIRVLNLSNVRLAAFNVSNIDEVFAEHEVDRLYINFCDPWPRNKHAKRRLTNINFLDKYRRILKPGARLHFKTDNRPLFDYSLEQFKMLNLDVDAVTFDLHADNPIDNIETEYERKFSTLGATINSCVVHF